MAQDEAQSRLNETDDGNDERARLGAAAARRASHNRGGKQREGKRNGPVFRLRVRCTSLSHTLFFSLIFILYLLIHAYRNV